MVEQYRLTIFALLPASAGSSSAAHAAAKSAAPAAYQVNVGSPGDLRAEVDRILDKINSQGFGALTAEEKRMLDEAKDLLSRR